MTATSCRFLIPTTTRPTSTDRPAPSTTEPSTGECESKTRRMAGLRRGLDRAHVQRRWLAENSGLCHGVLQRRAGSESLRVEGPNAVQGHSVLQKIRPCPHQAAGARRQKRAHQLQKYLGQRAEVAFKRNIVHGFYSSSSESNRR